LIILIKIINKLIIELFYEYFGGNFKKFLVYLLSERRWKQ